MGGRCHRDKITGHVNPIFREFAGDGRKARVYLMRIEMAQGEVYPGILICEHLSENRISYHITGRQFRQGMDLFHKPLPAAIQEPGPFAPDGFADQEGFLPRKGEGRGMKLNKFQIGNLSPRLISQGNPVAGGGVGICGTAVNPRQSTRGHDHGTSRENDVFPV